MSNQGSNGNGKKPLMLPSAGCAKTPPESEDSTGSATTSPESQDTPSSTALQPTSGNAIIDALRNIAAGAVPPDMVAITESGVAEEAFQAGVPAAMHEVMDLMVNASSEKVRGNMARFWLQVSGYNAVQKVAIKKHTVISYTDAKLIAKIMEEDGDA
jgi:hypothetical protein